ncbi:D5 N like family protein [Rodentibacter trehalosifermentans]|uniref:D5 N like family protein n=1 Tax=Rodentibacter trehalosifermentans TaxID=1908263 RepID=A0A1V3IMN9_9PAST|nr:DUF5906 domain-containing protein [Rodentibacter trehalosifermentans]OOF42846.1 D5 N like family protein [Rodentibacter trehalosifermentans]
MKTKRKNAPYLAEQAQDGSELIILIGSKAWQAWNKGEGLEWSLLAQAIKTDPKQPPVIIGESQLEEINLLNLAENDRTSVRLCQFGKFSHSEALPAVVANLAKNTQVRQLTLCDSLGELQENGNLSDWLKRTREQKGDSVADILAEKQNKKAVMIDFLSEKPTQKEIAEAFLDWIDKPLRRDINEGKPLEYNGLYWEPMQEHHLQRKVMDFYDEFGGDYTARHLKSIADLIVLKADEIPAQSPDFIGFENGVINKKTGEFLAHSINHYLRGIEKISCNIQSKNTPHFDDWIEFVTDGNTNKKNAILAGLYMVLTNRHEWGLFLEATGVAGAGKSVFSQIASIINGCSNTAYISLQELEIDKKRAMLIGKSLAISPDQKPYKGSADELKAITGGDSITVKINYVGDFSTKLTPVFMLVTNYPLNFIDRNGGIGRRRIIIPFDRPIPKEKKDVHFAEKVQSEVYGIVNKLLALFPDPDKARAILEDYKELDEGKNIKREANHLIDFLGHFEIREHRTEKALRVGKAQGGFIPYGDRTGRPDSIYSAYLYFCECNGLTPINRFSFNNSIADAFKILGEKIPYEDKMHYGHPTTNVYWKNRDLSIRQWEG